MFLPNLFGTDKGVTARQNFTSWISSMASRQSSAGVMVNSENAMGVAAFRACVTLLAESIAQLPCELYRRTADGGRKRATDHPVYKLIHSTPNRKDTSFEYYEQAQGSLGVEGNHIALIERDSYGYPIELIPVNFKKVKVLKGNDGLPYYRLLDYNDTVPMHMIHHIKAFSIDGYVGLSPLQTNADTIGLTIATEQHAAAVFQRGATMSGVIERPKDAPAISDQAKVDNLLNKFTERHGGGLRNAFSVALLQEGMQYKQLSMDNEKAQLIESRGFGVVEICRLYKVPPHMVQQLDKATFCLHADTEVFTDKGPVRIADICAGDKVWSRNENGALVLSNVLKMVCSGVDPIITIKTTNRTIKLNAQHRVLARRSYERPLQPGEIGGRNSEEGKKVRIEWRTEYVPAGDLKIGDTLVALDKTPSSNSDWCPTRKVTEEFMEFCGLYAGDGHMGKNSISIARANNAPYMDYYRETIPTLFTKNDGGNGRGDQSKVNRASIVLQEGDRYTRFSSVSAVKEMKEIGFGGTARSKSVPYWVFSLSDNLKLAFLRGFLESDGSVDKNGRISFSSCNKKLLSGIRHLCMSLGIPVTNFYERKGTNTLPTGNKIEFHQFYFNCSDPGANRLIGSHNPQDLERLINGKPFNKKGRNYPRFGGKGFSEEGLSLSRIVDISVGEPEPVYDMEVAETHSFIADGLVVHNSNIEHQQLQYVIYTLLPWVKRHEAAMMRDLLLADERNEYYIEFNISGLLRGDQKSRYEAYAIGRNWGWLSVNDIRRLENMPPIVGGDRYLTPLNMVDSGNTKNALNATEQQMKDIEEILCRV